MPYKQLIFIATLSFITTALFAQSITPTNGMRKSEPSTTAIVGAKIRTTPTQSIEHGTVVFTDGIIVAVGKSESTQIPDGAQIILAEGMTLAPAFVEPQLEVEVVRADGGDSRHPVARVHPEVDVSTLPMPEERMRILRSAGFSTAQLIPKTGALAGQTSVIPIDQSPLHRGAYQTSKPMLIRFEYGGNYGSSSYPGSLTGSVALVRQTLHDATWHAQNSAVAQKGHVVPPLPSASFIALRGVIEGKQHILFDLQHESDAFRAQHLADEFNLEYTLLGTGTEYRRLDEIVALHRPLVIPVDFPKRPDISTPDQLESVSLKTLMEWEQAPTNTSRLHQAGVPFLITMHGVNNNKSFFRNIQKTINSGLEESDVLEALTGSPAIGKNQIAIGAFANMQLVDGEFLDPDRTLRDLWINGRRHRIERDTLPAGASSYELTIGSVILHAEIDRDNKRFSMTDAQGNRVKLRKSEITVDGITAMIDTQTIGGSGWGSLLIVVAGESLSGSVMFSDGSRIAVHGKPADSTTQGQHGRQYTGWMDIGSSKIEMTLEVPTQEGGSAILRSKRTEYTLNDFSIDAKTGQLTAWFERPDSSRRDLTGQIEGDEIRGTVTGRDHTSELHLVLGDTPPPLDENQSDPPQELPVPFGAFGRFELPAQQNIRFEHATLWTSSTAGIIEDGCLVIRDGDIAFAGSMDKAPRPSSSEEIVDATGLHITPGLIDAHSHTGLRGGVNEWTQANTAEVRMSDVINPDDINFYRQLAGGLTTANQLHGSANPIGGQSSVVKLRWGASSDDMRFTQATPAIKFALGENVKRSSQRYPNTRMGVETFDRDSFLAAVDYKAEWEAWNSLPNHKKSQRNMPRKDLELDTLVEIMNGERKIHCHSYRQDEILMLVRLAEDLGFTIGTFQHVLEGYKVAEIIAAHGAHASCFSDWWAYKEEVMDAIPYNGAIMHNGGAVVSFNSDSSNLARRMNTEATKAMRWGDVSPETALNFITINPAIQLGVENYVGSLEKGKHADIAVWNGDPLSTETSCLQTWIDGAPYFDIEEDAALQAWALSERTRLLDAVLAASFGELEPPAANEHEVSEVYTCSDH